jgi:hypothetical protein
MRTYDDVVRHLKVLLPGTESLQRSYLSPNVDELVSAGKIVKADTVPALAARLGIPADNLSAPWSDTTSS